MTIFKLIVKENDPKKLGSFLLKNGFSRQALNKSKHHHGGIFVNHKRRYTSFLLKKGDEVIFLTGEEKRIHGFLLQMEQLKWFMKLIII